MLLTRVTPAHPDELAQAGGLVVAAGHIRPGGSWLVSGGLGGLLSYARGSLVIPGCLLSCAEVVADARVRGQVGSSSRPDTFAGFGYASYSRSFIAGLVHAHTLYTY